MSRLPLPETPRKISVPPEFVLMVEKLDDAPITAAQIAAWTRRDPLLADVFRYIQNGWPASANKALLDEKSGADFSCRMHHVGWKSGCATVVESKS